METPQRTKPTGALLNCQNIRQADEADVTGTPATKVQLQPCFDASTTPQPKCGGDSPSAAEGPEAFAAREGAGDAEAARDSSRGERCHATLSTSSPRCRDPSPGDSGCSSSPPVDPEAESLALARQLLEEEAMASYAAAVDLFRGTRPEDAGVAADIGAEDMAVVQALLEEDQESVDAPDALALTEQESLDYEGMLELGTAIGDVRKERWRIRCKGIIHALPRFLYALGDSGAGDDTKCLICQCDFEDGDELRLLPCSHSFHTECVDGWLEENEECPTCRRSIQAPSKAK